MTAADAFRHLVAAGAVTVATCLATTVLAAGLELTGDAVQGGLLRGTVPGDARVTLNETPVRLSPQGRFIVGFGRDFNGPAILRVHYGDGTVETRALSVQARQYKIQRIDGLPPKMVTPSAEALERIRRENGWIAAARRLDTAQPWFDSGFIWPVKGTVTGVFGSQRILNGEPRRPHYGIDIAAPAGSPVVASTDGRVALAETDLYYTGGTVMLDHGHGLTSVYSHLASVEVEVGTALRQGDRLGTVGSSGRSTGPHLDWRLNWFKERLDPALLLPPQ